MNDESCLDRFAKANLVRQQNSRRITGSDFLSDKELVWNQRYAWPQKPLDRRCRQACLMLQGQVAKVEPTVIVNLKGE